MNTLVQAGLNGPPALPPRKRIPIGMLLLMPNMMLTRDNDAIPDRWRAVAPRLMSVQTEGTTPR